jgi:photosystem II stability/assembly factor-like uncharacterized protein
MYTNRVIWGILLFCVAPLAAYGLTAHLTDQTQTSNQAYNLEWFYLNPAGNSLYGVSFVNPNVATAVGVKGTILRSEDGGVTWYHQNSGTEVTLIRVDFTDPDTGTAVGSSGTILRTTDGGSSWVSQSSGTSATLRQVKFFDTDTGIVIGSGGTILRTVNGGADWATIASGTVEDLFDLSFVDSKSGLAVGHGGAVFRTDDGGLSWSDKSTAAAYDFRNISMTDSLTAMATLWDAATLDDRVVSTVDGGDTWEMRWDNHGCAVGSHCDVPLDIRMVDDSTGSAAGLVAHDTGHYGSVWQTEDGGRNWSHVGWGSSTFREMSFADIDLGLSVGDDGEIIRTTDGGTTWQTIRTKLINTESLDDVVFVTEDIGWAAGYERGYVGDMLMSVHRTVDGGRSWHERGVGSSLGCVRCLSISFLNENIGVAAEMRGDVSYTEDGGNSWSQIHSSDASLFGVEMCDSNSITAVGSDGTILRATKYFGSDWYFEEQTSGTNNHLRDVSFVGPDYGWAVGDAGTIVHTIDGGDNWVVRDGGTTENLTGVCFPHAGTGTAVGHSGTIIRTFDWGATWTPQESGVTADLYDVSFSDVLTGAIAGAGGTVLLTADLGAHWTKQVVPSDAPLYAISMLNPTVCTTVGSGGVILRAEEVATAVLVTGFSAIAVDNGIRLTWSVFADETVEGFRIYRSDPNGGSEYPIHNGLIAPTERSYLDETAVTGERYRYTLVAVGTRTGEVRSESVEATLTPLTAQLYQNSPNPFNPGTTIRYVVPKPSEVTLRVYSASGHLVRTLVEGVQLSGLHEVRWNGTNNAGSPVASGVYFCRLRTGKATLTRKMVVLK